MEKVEVTKEENIKLLVGRVGYKPGMVRKAVKHFGRAEATIRNYWLQGRVAPELQDEFIVFLQRFIQLENDLMNVD